MLWLANAGSSTAAPHDDFWYEPAVRAALNALGHGTEAAMRLSAVYRSVKVLGETLGQVPLILYRSLRGGGKERAVEHPLYRLVGLQPNGLQTSLEWREMMQAHLELRGYAYSQIQFKGSAISGLWPLHPDRMKAELLSDRNRLRYTYTPAQGQPVVLNQDEVLHLRGLAMDGFQGINPIETQRRTLNFAVDAANFGHKTYASDAVQRGWVEHPNNFKDREAREEYRRVLSGQLNDGRVPILEYGLKYHEVGIKLTDAQYLENRKYSDVEIASRIFGVPPHKIGILDKATWANIESQNIEFVTEAILARARRWEQRLNITLLSDEEQEAGYFFEFLLDGLLRGDSAARAAFYEKLLKNRVMVPNEARERENLNPVEWGNDPLPMPNESLRSGSRPEEREAALERSAAQAVVQKELHQVRSLAWKLEGKALAEAVSEFYSGELAPFVARVLSVPYTTAVRYAADSDTLVSAAATEGRLTELLAEWKASRAGQLLEIIHA